MSETSEGEEVLPLWDHISELSRRIKVWIYAFVISTLFFLIFPADPVSFFQNPFQTYRPLITEVIKGIRERLLPPQYTLIGGTVTSPLEIIVVGAAVFGFATSVPILAYEIYKFVDPAIKPTERQSLYPFVAAFSILFISGALFAFFVLLPFVFLFSLPFFNAVGFSTFIYADDFFNLIFFVLVASGFAFTIPAIFVLLVKLHVMGTSALRKNRKYVWAITLIATALASPDGGPLADIALFVPMIILIEGAMWFAKRYEKDDVIGVSSKMGETKCSYCGGQIDPGGIFCGLCGKARV
ncbi:MAG TPA: twin-arginine translocase subunit TatC [Candidatus Bathyarchaeia archaeon]